MTESFPARSGNGQTYAFPPYVSGELSGRATTLRRTSGESATFGSRVGPGVPVIHAMLAQAVVAGSARLSLVAVALQIERRAPDDL
jgi:hypothetical protein